MTDGTSLRARLWRELTEDLAVSVVAVGLALLAYLLTSASDVVDGVPLVVVNLAVFLPWIYGDVWPEQYVVGPAVVWTVVAGVLTAGVFLGAYAIGIGVTTPDTAAVGAFLVTVTVQYAVALAYARTSTEP